MNTCQPYMDAFTQKPAIVAALAGKRKATSYFIE